MVNPSLTYYALAIPGAQMTVFVRTIYELGVDFSWYNFNVIEPRKTGHPQVEKEASK